MQASKPSLFSTAMLAPCSLSSFHHIYLGATWLFVLFEIPRFSLSIVQFCPCLVFRICLRVFLGCYLFLHVRLSLMRFLWVGRRDETDGNWEVFCF